jgi:hypothetical protein
MSKILFKEKDTVICVNTEPLTGNDVHPPLEKGKKYSIKGIALDKEGNQHLDVGLVSKHNYVTSYETKETLPTSGVGGIHWCHPSRFPFT